MICINRLKINIFSSVFSVFICELNFYKKEMEIENFYVFVLAAIVFVITPGMDTLFVLNKSLSSGKRSGLYASLGINSGVVVHTLLGALGISLIISQSEIGFSIIKYAGSFYICYIGLKNLKSKNGIVLTSEESHQENKRSFWSGFMTNALNPKVAIFFMAFFPQFIQANAINNPIPFLLLGVTYSVLGMIWLLTIAAFAGKFSLKLKSKPHLAQTVTRVSGILFILMGIGVFLM